MVRALNRARARLGGALSPEQPNRKALIMSKAAATRWLASNVGRHIDTHQVATSGRVWQPGPRALGMTGGTFTLDGSRVTFTRQHVVTAIDADSFTVEWRDDDGAVIYTTTYRVAS